MEISIIGTGYVGLVTGACLADCGNMVHCVDTDNKKVALLCEGQMPFYEPGLETLARRNVNAGRLRFSTNPATAGSSEMVFLTVGTPADSAGRPDMAALISAVTDIAPHLARNAVVVLKSTVPPGTNASVEKRLRHLLGRHCDVVNNPEFLCEGSAVWNSLNPDRIIVGVRRPALADLMETLYAPFLAGGAEFIVMSCESAELAKYAANALLAMKVAFINEIATMCDPLGAQIDEVRRGIATDRRIGFEFLSPGPGYGGSCFPKDVLALKALAAGHGMRLPLVGAIGKSNNRQKQSLADKIAAHFGGNLRGRKIAVWGLAFKAGTDDIRESPSLEIIDSLLAGGADIRVHDPAASANVRRIYDDDLCYCDTAAAAITDAAAVIVMTDWDIYREFKPEGFVARMRTPTIFDARYLYDPREFREAGIDYHAIGRGCRRRGGEAAIDGIRTIPVGRRRQLARLDEHT